MEEASAQGAAYDATIRIGAPEEADELRRLQLADLEARENVERMAAKVEKYEGHLESVRKSLADAQAAAEEAAYELENFPGEVAE